MKEKYQYSWTLLKELVKTEFKLRYKGSLLGMLWSALKPFLLFLIMYIVFVHFLRMGQGIPHYAVSLLLGTVLWSFFSESTNHGMGSIVYRGGVLRKINIPKYIIPLSTTCSALVNLGINLVIVFIFALINGVYPHWSMLLIFPIIVELFIFSFGLSLLLSSLYVKFRDVSHIWEVFMQGAFYATPIFWPISMILTQNLLAGKAIMLIPMAQIIQDARWVFVTNATETIYSVINNPLLWFIPFIFIALVVTVGILYFRKSSKYFTEIM